MGQTSFAALSQTVKTKFICGASGLENSSQLLLRAFSVGRLAACSCFRASGRTVPVGMLPALKAVKFGLRLPLRMDSAMMERAEFPVQRNSTLKCWGMRIDLRALGAAGRAAAGLGFRHWLGCADEGAKEFAVHLGCDRVHVEALAGEKFAGVFDVVNARGFDFSFGKSGGVEFAEIIVFFERPRDTSDPEQNASTNFGKNFAAGNNVGDSEAAAGFEDAKCFAEDSVFIGRKIDHTI